MDRRNFLLAGAIGVAGSSLVGKGASAQSPAAASWAIKDAIEAGTVTTLAEVDDHAAWPE